MIITQQDTRIVIQNNKTILYKIELLNSTMAVINTLEGNLISDSLSISAESDVRRTYNCELVVTDSSFTINETTGVWYGAKIRPYIGVIDTRTKDTVWYLLGTFLFTDYNYNYNPTTKTLSLTCLDLMCLLNDSRNGQLDEYKRKLKAGEDIRSIIISLLNQAGINHYYIEFGINGEVYNTFELPYDKDYEAGTTVYTIINDLITLYPGTQMYFDLNGVFNIRSEPMGKDEICMLNNEILSQIVIEETASSSLSNVYNKIIIWGKVIEADWFTTDVTFENNCYNANVYKDTTDEDKTTWIAYDKYIRGDKISIRVPCSNAVNQKLSVNSLAQIPIVNEEGVPLQEGLLVPNTDYVFRYRDNDLATPQFVLLGSYQCYGEAYLTNNINDNSLFAVKDEYSDICVEQIGVITKVVSGNECENIYTDDLARTRCKYELYQYAHSHETLDLNIIAVPWLDVNDIIEYKPITETEIHQYIIKNISVNYSEFTMTLSLQRYYPMYLGEE